MVGISLVQLLEISTEIPYGKKPDQVYARWKYNDRLAAMKD